MEHLGTGRAKLLLFGEHAAVYGYPAVGLSLKAALTARLCPGEGDLWRIEGVQERERERILALLALLADLSSAGPAAQRGGGSLRLQSQIPRDLGFGSSAALCVALAAAVASWRGETARERIWELAHRGERLFHGTPSGIDTGLALLGGLYLFRPRPPQLPAAEELAGVPLHLVTGAVPRRRSAGALIGGLRRKLQRGDEQTLTILQRLGARAEEAARILSSRAGKREEEVARDLGALAREAQQDLGRLGLTTPELERLLEQGRRMGALGGKLSGAGGGGAFFLLYPNAEAARGAASSLRELSRAGKLPTADTIGSLSWSPAERAPGCGRRGGA